MKKRYSILLLLLNERYFFILFIIKINAVKHKQKHIKYRINHSIVIVFK